jgi:hypothetical protein
MHAVVRSYSGAGAKELFDLLEQRKAEVEDLIRAVSGFVAYTLIRTDDGGVTVTVCQDKGGTDESLQVARDWIQLYASDLNTSPPAVSQGSVLLDIPRTLAKRPLLRGKRTTDVRFFSYAQIPIAHPTGIIAQASLLTPWCSALI